MRMGPGSRKLGCDYPPPDRLAWPAHDGCPCPSPADGGQYSAFRIPILGCSGDLNGSNDLAFSVDENLTAERRFGPGNPTRPAGVTRWPLLEPLMPIPNEDRLRERHDAMLTHDDPHSPYYDGPDGEDTCETCGKPIRRLRMRGGIKMSKILKQIEGLGHAAAQCDLWAASSPKHTTGRRPGSEERAAFYREEQAMLLEQNRARTERWRGDRPFLP